MKHVITIALAVALAIAPQLIPQLSPMTQNLASGVLAALVNLYHLFQDPPAL